MMNSNPKNGNVKNVSEWDSGGGVVIDVVELNDGRVLGITEEIVILYASMNDLTEGDPAVNRPAIQL
ncbi:hypothetical protein ACFL54_06985 [Planctomycetota bacterium]